MGNDDLLFNLPTRERASAVQAMLAKVAAADWLTKPWKRAFAEAAAVYGAIAAGRLVPVERVAEMRERAAHVAADWPIQWDKERGHDCIGVALAIRALPLDGTGGAHDDQS